MGVNYEGDVEETNKDVHDGYGKEEEVMSPVEIWTFLDDQAEEEVMSPVEIWTFLDDQAE